MSTSFSAGLKALRMTTEQRYTFDTLGYVVLKNVLSPQQVGACNAALDRLEQADQSHWPQNVRLGKPKTDNEMYIVNIVEADPAFHPLIDLPGTTEIISETALGLFRLNHTYAILRWQTGYTYMHMGASPLHPKATYMCHNGQILSLTTKVVFPLLNSRPEDGCFAVIPGSHKSAFPRPFGDHPDEVPMLHPVEADPGDAIVFTEALTHGSMVNTSGRPRRTVYYCYSVGYMPDWTKFGLVFSEGFGAQLSERQREIIRLKVD